MANLNVTYADINNAANQLTTGQQDIENKLNELKSFIDNLVSEGYVTEQSSVAFQEQYQQFTTSTVGAVGALQGMAQFLRSAATALQDTDASLANAIRGQG